LLAQLLLLVPFALHGGTALGTGRGEELATVLARNTFHWALAFGTGGLSTAAVYAEIDKLEKSDAVMEALMDAGFPAVTKVSVVGRLAGPVPEFNTATLFFRRIRMGGVAVGAWTSAESRAAWAELVSLMASRNARPLVDSVVPFADLPKAFERLAQGPMGKVILKVGQ